MKLALGSAQFGSAYGVSNKQGKLPIAEVRNILSTSGKNGITIIDTAALYGDSETVIGNALSAQHRFHIVTKTPVFKTDRMDGSHAEQLRTTFHRSLVNLRQRRLYGLLIHHADDLLVPGGSLLVEEMRSLVDRGLVGKIGVSVYTARQIDGVLDLFTPDIVQLPINLFDQRLAASGHLATLKRLGVEVHARSIFLQGLLLMDPGAMLSYFAPFRGHFERYARFLGTHRLSGLQASLLFIRQQMDIDYAVVGVTRASELSDIITALRGYDTAVPDMDDLAVDDEALINPSLWKVREA